MVAIGLGMCRSGRIGGTSGVDSRRERQIPRAAWRNLVLRGRAPRLAINELYVAIQPGMMVEAAPPASFIIARVELLVIALDPLSRVARKVDGSRL